MDETITRYAVIFSDEAQAEAEAIYLSLSQRLSLAYATRWFEDLIKQAEQNLSFFPARFAVAPEHTLYPNVVVRRMLYGRGRFVYRLLYHIIEPDQPGELGMVRILRVLHGAQQTRPSEDEE